MEDTVESLSSRNLKQKGTKKLKRKKIDVDGLSWHIGLILRTSMVFKKSRN